MPSFGQVSSEASTEAAISEDGRALTVTLGGGVDAESSHETGPVVIKTLSLVIPIQAEGSVQIEFVLDGTVFTEGDANATTILSVNGRTSVMDFSAETDESLSQVLTFFGFNAKECRVTLAVILGRGEGEEGGSSALVTIPTLDAEFLPRPT